MNLKQFMAHRSNCPICDGVLGVSFHSPKRQTIRYEENRLIVLFPLDGLKKQIDYKVGYSFGLEDNSWHLEFYTKDEVRFEKESPLFLIERFRGLNANLKTYCFFKQCIRCRRYNCYSNSFVLSSHNKIPDIQLETEFFGLVSQVSDGYKVNRLTNNYLDNTSNVMTFKSDTSYASHVNSFYPKNAMTMVLPLMNFTSKDQMNDRINNLIIFS